MRWVQANAGHRAPSISHPALASMASAADVMILAGCDENSQVDFLCYESFMRVRADVINIFETRVFDNFLIDFVVKVWSNFG